MALIHPFMKHAGPPLDTRDKGACQANAVEPLLKDTTLISTLDEAPSTSP